VPLEAPEAFAAAVRSALEGQRPAPPSAASSRG
jgi:hypothetical protein